MFPPSENFNLFFFNKCASSLQVVDLPLVPVTTTLLDLFLFLTTTNVQTLILILWRFQLS